jgi:biofilm PGA synthesis lipoprotein PgaB
MPGTFLSRLVLVLLALPLAVAAGGRKHEIQFRRNDYAVVPAPARLQGAGLSKALLRVFSDDESKGGLYFHSGLFPVVRSALDAWSGEFAAGTVPLWAWMGARKFAWLTDRELLDREWHAGGARLIPKLDLFNPRAQELVVKLFGQLAGQRVQGILIQDDLTLLRSEGFSSWGRASFAGVSGLDAEPRRMLAKGTAHHGLWEDLKARRVGETLARIVAACQRSNPAVQVGLNVHYEAPLTPERARSWYAFDAAAASAAGLDFFYLMAYHRQIKAEMKLGEGDARIYFRRMLEAALKLWGPRLVVKLQVRDWQSSEPIPLAELKIYYDLIPTGVERVCFAAADPEDIDLISKVIAK